jgi:ABC-type branched-subunit amino acid transport system ATPase component
VLIGAPRYLRVDKLSLGLAPVVVSRLIPVIATVAESGAGVLLIEQFATVALGLATAPTSWRAAGSASPARPANYGTTRPG